MAASTLSVDRRRQDEPEEEEEESGDESSGGEYDEPDDEYEMRKESAVYGYIHKPEIIEFRGQYYYGANQENPNSRYNRAPVLEYDEGAAEPVPEPYPEPHRMSIMSPHYESFEHEPALSSALLLGKLKKGTV